MLETVDDVEEELVDVWLVEVWLVEVWLVDVWTGVLLLVLDEELVDV